MLPIEGKSTRILFALKNQLKGFAKLVLFSFVFSFSLNIEDNIKSFDTRIFDTRFQINQKPQLNNKREVDEWKGISKVVGGVVTP